MQPYPAPDHTRENRVIADIAGLLHEPYTLSEDEKTLTMNEEVRKKVRRWIRHVLDDIASRRKWWFLENVATLTLQAGQDIIDFTGHVDKVAAVFGPKRLIKASLQEITERRMNAAANGSPNAGPLTRYALEAGRRLHTWPAPPAATAFGALYMRPMDLPILPRMFEVIVLNGVIGTFGRHFDRDALTEDPADFETRYEKQLTRAAVDSWDIERVPRWDDAEPAGNTVTPLNSTTDVGTSFLVPASISGIGYVTIETGDYPLVVA